MTVDGQMTGIVGARGIGKTTFLLRHVIEAGAYQGNALYVSADNLYFLEHRLIDLVDSLYKETDVRVLCIDEVHKYQNWNQELKNIADTYIDFRLVFSGSSMIDIVHSKYDLSRRVILHHLHGLSFREFLKFFLDIQLPTFSLEDLAKNHLAIANEINVTKILKYFKEYLRVGYYPFFKDFQQERDKFQAIENATQKTIYEDIATLHSLKTPTLLIIEKLLKFIINSSPGEISAYKLANVLSKDFNSINEYLRYLEQAGLVRFLYSRKSGHAYLRSPIKMYPENTNLIYASYLTETQDMILGKARETFVINQLQNAHYHAYYSETGDFYVNKILFEVGGRNKTKKQIKNQKDSFILADSILVGSKRVIPLYLLGLLY